MFNDCNKIKYKMSDYPTNEDYYHQSIRPC